MLHSTLWSSLALCLCVSLAQAQTGPAIAINLGYSVLSIDAGDFNQDGLQDAVHVGSSALGHDLHIELNQGPGVLPLGLTFPGLGGYEVRALDLDLDGDLDFLCSSAPAYGITPTTLKVVINNAGTLNATTIQVRGSALPDLVDLDNDGLPDLLSNGAWNPGLSPGVFAASSIPIVAQVIGFPLPEISFTREREYYPGDFDGDGDIDLLRYRRTGGGLNGLLGFADLYKNDGIGNFIFSISEAVAFPSIQVPSTRISVADFNGDGIDDFVAEQLGSGSLLIHYGDPFGYFLGGTWAVPGLGAFITTADLDGDGDRDLIVGRPVSTAPIPPIGPTPPASLNVIENVDAGVFIEPANSTLSFFASRFRAVDLDGDLKDDFLFTGPFNSQGFGVAYGAMVSSSPVPHRRINSVVGFALVSPANTQISVPWVVQVLDESGFPVAGETLTILGDDGLNLPGTVLTDASGFGTIPMGTPARAGLKRITVSCNNGKSLRGYLQITPTQLLTVVSGDQQGANPLTTFPQPLRLKVTDLAGTPLVGVPVEILERAPNFGIFGSPFITDLSGEVSASIFSDTGGSPGNVGNIGKKFLLARSPASGDLVVEFFNRRLIPLNFFDATGTYRGVRYHHENIWVPLILMADVPQPAPVSTIYGDFFTSWLSPGPSLFYLDGLGLTGPPAPGLLTVPKAGQAGFIYELTFPNTLLPWGTQVVFQVLSYDNAYGFPEKVGLSESVLIIF